MKRNTTLLSLLLLLFCVLSLSAQNTAKPQVTQSDSEMKAELDARKERIALKEQLLEARRREAELDKQLGTSAPKPKTQDAQVETTETAKPDSYRFASSSASAETENAERNAQSERILNRLLDRNDVRNSALAAPVNAASAAPATAAPVVTTTPCAALTTASPEYERNLCGLPQTLIGTSYDPDISKAKVTIDADADFNALNVLILKALGSTIDQNVVKFLVAEEQKRTDKQPGGDAKGSGSTSLVVKGGIPAFLSVAQENGAVESTQSGNVFTFRANPVGLAEWLAGSNYFGNFGPAPQQIVSGFFRNDKDPFTRFLRNTSLGLSFDVTQGDGTAANPVLTATRQQLSAVSVRYEVFNERDPRNAKYKDDWVAFAKDAGDGLLTRSIDLKNVMLDANREFKIVEMKAWQVGLETAMTEKLKPFLTATLVSGRRVVPVADRAAATEALKNVLLEHIAKIPLEKIKADAKTVSSFTNFASSVSTYLQKRKELIAKIRSGNVFTLEYTNYREVKAPNLSNFRLIYSRGFKNRSDVTFNASATMFDKMPAMVPAGAKVKRFRDFDFALQMDLPFDFYRASDDAEEAEATQKILDKEFATPLFGMPMWSFAAKYQRLQSDAVQPDGVVKPNTKGDLAFGQIKLIIPINFAVFSIKLPISASFANRTDLIKEKDVRGNFGFTFDIDPFFSKLRELMAGGSK